MSAAEEAQRTCSRCGCSGQLHREDEVVRGCQLARLRTIVNAARTFAEKHTMLGPDFDRLLLELNRFDSETL